MKCKKLRLISKIILFTCLGGIIVSMIICFLGQNYGIIVFILSLFFIYISTLLNNLAEKLENSVDNDFTSDNNN